jgi:hypothetical protein
LRIFSNFIHDTIEIYMDELTPYGKSFQEALTNLEKLLKRCQEMNISLIHAKFNILMREEFVLGYHISPRGI